MYASHDGRYLRLLNKHVHNMYIIYIIIYTCVCVFVCVCVCVFVCIAKLYNYVYRQSPRAVYTLPTPNKSKLPAFLSTTIKNHLLFLDLAIFSHPPNKAYWSANTILVFVTFSIVNFVFPPVPAILPIARDKWSPLSGFTSRKG